MNPIKLGVTIFVAVIAASIAWALLGALLSFGFKVAVVAAIGLVIYGLVSGATALGSGRGRLP
jgi:hypothetical protein